VATLGTTPSCPAHLRERITKRPMFSRSSPGENERPSSQDRPNRLGTWGSELPACRGKRTAGRLFMDPTRTSLGNHPESTLCEIRCWTRDSSPRTSLAVPRCRGILCLTSLTKGRKASQMNFPVLTEASGPCPIAELLNPSSGERNTRMENQRLPAKRPRDAEKREPTRRAGVDGTAA